MPEVGSPYLTPPAIARELAVKVDKVLGWIRAGSLTAPTLYRTLHSMGGTLILDEAERLKDTKAPGIGEILAMLLAGYRHGATATRLEPVGDSGFRTLAFEVFGPKALACIAGLPPSYSPSATGPRGTGSANHFRPET